ncbi:MAG TPA: hypothetical protein VF103_12155 [Polyangiaceae bacterium]
MTPKNRLIRENGNAFMYNRKITLTFVVLSLAAACSSSPPPEAASAATTPATPAGDTSTKPDIAATKKHLADHVKYPATRAEILAACADTPEFTAGEKHWFSDNLPEGSYDSADQVATALKL